MWCLLKSQLNGKAFLVLSADTDSDLDCIKGHLAEEAFQGCSEV